MKAHILKLAMCLLLLCSFEASPAPAAPPIFGIVKEAVKKAIKAIDLKIQKLQNKTIQLQNAQQQIENTLSRLKLNEISEWAQKQRDLYQQYYNELKEVKDVVTQYQRIRDITAKQARLLSEYQRGWNLFRQDDHFTPEELSYMEQVYKGILEESLENLEHIFTLVDSFTTSMSDAERLELINEAADGIDRNYDDLKRFNRQNILLTLQRAKMKKEVEQVRRLYGIPN